MSHFHAYLSTIPDDAEELTLSRAEAHHLIQVLRARNEDSISLFDGSGKVASGSLRIAGKEARIFVETISDLPPPSCFLGLACVMLKGKSTDTLLREAFACGVTDIYPLSSEHCQVHLNPKESEAKCARWREQLIEAAKQSGNLRLPSLHPPKPLESWLEAQSPNTRKDSLYLVGSLEPHTPLMLPQLQKLSTDKPIQGINLLIGPEGDFSPSEYQTIAASGIHPVRLGKNVLKAGTAALYALAIADQHLQSQNTASD